MDGRETDRQTHTNIWNDGDIDWQKNGWTALEKDYNSINWYQKSSEYKQKQPKQTHLNNLHFQKQHYITETSNLRISLINRKKGYCKICFTMIGRLLVCSLGGDLTAFFNSLICLFCLNFWLREVRKCLRTMHSNVYNTCGMKTRIICYDVQYLFVYRCKKSS